MQPNNGAKQTGVFSILLGSCVLLLQWKRNDVFSYSGGDDISVYPKTEAPLRLSALHLFSGKLYRNNFIRIFHYWLILLNQNQLSCATGLFAALRALMGFW